MTTNDPVPSQTNQPAILPAGLPVADFGSGDVMIERPTLYIDSGSGDRSKKPGSWFYCDAVIERPTLLLAAATRTRAYFSAIYDDDPKAPQSCGSWDGTHAFGYGGRSMAGEPRLRECPSCPLSKWRQLPNGKNHCECPTSILLFGMLIHANSDVWMPFFWNASGLNVRPAEAGWEIVRKMAMTTMKKGKDGVPRPTRAHYSYAAAVHLTKNLGRNGYTMRFDNFTDVPDADMQFIAPFLAGHGVAMWKAEMAWLEERIRGIGAQSPQGSDSGAPRATDVDYGTVPF